MRAVGLAVDVAGVVLIIVSFVSFDFIFEENDDYVLPVFCLKNCRDFPPVGH